MLTTPVLTGQNRKHNNWKKRHTRTACHAPRARTQRGTHPAHAHLSKPRRHQTKGKARQTHTLTHTQAIRRARAGRVQGLLRAWVCSARGVLAWRVHGVTGLLRKHELFFRLLVVEQAACTVARAARAGYAQQHLCSSLYPSTRVHVAHSSCYIYVCLAHQLHCRHEHDEPLSISISKRLRATGVRDIRYQCVHTV